MGHRYITIQLLFGLTKPSKEMFYHVEASK